MLWSTVVEPTGQVESLEVVLMGIWPLELRDGPEIQESVAQPLPASQQIGPAGLCAFQGRYTEEYCHGAELQVWFMGSFIPVGMRSVGKALSVLPMSFSNVRPLLG